MFDLVRLQSSGLVAHVDFHESLGSTSDRALEIAAADELPLPLLVLTERQTGGRGRQGRAWSSPEGNLYASTLIRVRNSNPSPATLALVAAVALEEAVSTFLFPGEGRGPVSKVSQLDPGLRRGTLIKWPNDLLIDGAKLSGILLERADDAIVIGFGVNLAHHPTDLERPATSLAEHGSAPDPHLFLETLAESLARWVASWREGLGPVRERWRHLPDRPGGHRQRCHARLLARRIRP